MVKCLTVGCENEATYITTLGERCERCTMEMKKAWERNTKGRSD